MQRRDEEQGGRIQKGLKERKGDSYIHLYIHHRGYERAQGPKSRPKNGHTQTESTGQTWHPINRKQIIW